MDFKRLVKLLVLIFSLHAFTLNMNAQEVIPPEDRLDWWDDIEGYYNQQAASSLELVEEMLNKYPPQLAEPLLNGLIKWD